MIQNAWILGILLVINWLMFCHDKVSWAAIIIAFCTRVLLGSGLIWVFHIFLLVWIMAWNMFVFRFKGCGSQCYFRVSSRYLITPVFEELPSEHRHQTCFCFFVFFPWVSSAKICNTSKKQTTQNCYACDWYAFVSLNNVVDILVLIYL